MCELVFVIVVVCGSGEVCRLVIVIRPQVENPKPDPKGFNANYGYD